MVATPCPPEPGQLQEEAARWIFLHDLFRPPEPAQWRWLQTPAVETAWTLLAELHHVKPRPWPVPHTYDRYQEEFLAAFDVGMPHPPCPLLESHWRRNQASGLIRQRNMRFYEQFGLRLRSADGSPPDHLRHQLAFAGYLCHFERERVEAGDVPEAEQAARARREYVALHLQTWVPAAAGHLAACERHSWPAGWMGLLAACVAAGPAPFDR